MIIRTTHTRFHVETACVLFCCKKPGWSIKTAAFPRHERPKPKAKRHNGRSAKPIKGNRIPLKFKQTKSRGKHGLSPI